MDKQPDNAVVVCFFLYSNRNNAALLFGWVFKKMNCCVRMIILDPFTMLNLWYMAMIHGAMELLFVNHQGHIWADN